VDTGAAATLGTTSRQVNLNGPTSLAGAKVSKLYSYRSIEHLENHFFFLRSYAGF